MEFVKTNKKWISLAVFCLIAIAMIAIAALVLKQPIVPVCVILLIEVAIAVMLHNAELWMHGVLVLAEIIAGIVLGKIVIIILCVVIYIAATLTLKLIEE